MIVDKKKIIELLEYAKLIKKSSQIMRENFHKKIDGWYEKNVSNLFQIPGVKVTFHQNKNVQVFIFSRKGKKIILFPESYGKDDWRNNLLFFKKNEYHRGFLSQYEKIKGVFPNNILLKGKNVILGWSLGGAIATIMASKYNKYDMEFITFGQPKVVSFWLSRKINKWHKKNFFRVANKSDIVTKVPFKWLNIFTWGYRHVGMKISVGKSSYFQKVIKFWEWKKWRVDEKMNHHIDEYIKLLETNIKK